jgi:hypothetical protein
MNKKMNLLLSALLVTSILSVGCGQKTTDQPQVEGTAEVTIQASNVQEEEVVKDASTVAKETVQAYFHETAIDDLTIEETDFTEDIKIINLYANNSEFYKYSVRVDVNDLKAFMIQSSAASGKLRSEAIYATGIADPSINEVYDYKYSLTPITEEEALLIAEDFIMNSPLGEKTYTLKNTNFEYKFDSQDKEFFVFEYDLTDNEDNVSTSFIKIDNYMQVVTEITGL